MVANLDLAQELVERHQTGGDFAVFDRIVAANFVDRTAARPGDSSKDSARGYFEMLRRAFPDLRVEVHDQAAVGDKVWTRKSFHGTHLGSYAGIAPTGREVAWNCIDILRFVDGKVVEHWGIEDLAALIDQLKG